MKKTRTKVDGGTIFTILLCIIFMGFFLNSSFVSGLDSKDERKEEKKEIASKTDNKTEKKQVSKKQESKKENKKEKDQKVKPLDPTKKYVFLTFDDGPSARTTELLKILKEEKVKATFFVVGTSLKDKKTYLQNIAKEGHYIGLHSMTHLQETLYAPENPKVFMNEMKELKSIVKKETGKNSILIRAPYGSMGNLDESYEKELIKQKYKLWDWTIDAMDWKYKTQPNMIVEEVKKQTFRDREIVLMHENVATLKALKEIIKFYKENGYEFRTYHPDIHFPVNQLQNEDL